MIQAKTTTAAAAATTKPIKAKQKQMLTGYSCMRTSEIASEKNNNNQKVMHTICKAQQAKTEEDVQRDSECEREREWECGVRERANGMRVCVRVSTNI